MSKGLGLLKKYSITKISNPKKDVDAIVLEFDDPIAVEGIIAWAEEMYRNGYKQVHADVISKIDLMYGPFDKHD